jgi:ATP-dependent RNA helicase DDX5/DBP2
MSSKEMPSSDKEKLTKEEKAAKKARKEAKAAKLAAASAAPRQSPRLQAMAAAEAIPSIDLAPAADKKDKKDKEEKKAKKRAAEASSLPSIAEDEAPPAKKAKKDKEEKKAKKEKMEEAPASSSSGGAGGSCSKALSADAFREEHAISGSSELPDPVQHIDDAPFDARLRSALRAAKFTAPSPIQAQAWPVALAGKDVIAIAKTGSGKTLGFLFPAFSAILPKLPLGQGVGPLALVMAPVRELAQQIQVEAERFGAAVGIKSLVVYGGAPKGPQIGALTNL